MERKRNMKTIEEYMALPYTMIVRWETNDGLFVARVKEIDGCTGHGDSEAEAVAMLRDNLREWIEFCLESGEQIPVPTDPTDLPSGKWLQRAPRSLHAALTLAAEEEGVSLNQYVVSVLSREIGSRETRGEVVGSVTASAPALADPWASLTDTVYAEWNVDTMQASKSSAVVFLRTLMGALPNEGQSPALRTKHHAKSKETVWN
jgi:antitoxin HicB